MTDIHQPLRDAPSDRIKRFVDARTGMQGLDPDIVHGVNTKGEHEYLLLSDLRAILADLDAAVKDAERWRELLNHVGADRQGGRFGFTLYTLQPLRGTNPMQGAVCQHFTASIDAALSQIKAAGREG